MILPVADALMNCLQNLTSRIAGIDNEMMTGRVMGMGAMLGYGLHSIKEQFKSPSSNINNENSNNSNSNNAGGGLKGFVNRAKSVVNPGMNLSSEKDYNGNVNPIRDVLPKEKTSKTSIPKSNGNSANNLSKGKEVAKKVIKAGFNGAKAYIDIGARMAEGDFNKSPYINNNYINKKKMERTEYINKVSNDREIRKLGDENGNKE